MELDIALYNLSSGGGVITSHQLSLQPGTANRKVSNVAAGEKIREENPENSKAKFRKNTHISSAFVFLITCDNSKKKKIRVELHAIKMHFSCKSKRLDQG